jgi:hypothetical protein
VAGSSSDVTTIRSFCRVVDEDGFFFFFFAAAVLADANSPGLVPGSSAMNSRIFAGLPAALLFNLRELVDF